MSVEKIPATALSTNTLREMREWFVKQNDKRLGRWRWPENPDYVVYPQTTDRVLVFSERYADFRDFGRKEAAASEGVAFRGAARAYFDAHPESKPWHDAKPHDVYVVTWPGSGAREPVVVPSTGWPRAWECVTSAERIWDSAEVQS